MKKSLLIFCINNTQAQFNLSVPKAIAGKLILLRIFFVFFLSFLFLKSKSQSNIQFIHCSPSTNTVDIWMVNSGIATKIYENVAFRDATPNLQVTSGNNILLCLAPEFSTSITDTVLSKNIGALMVDSSYTIYAIGHLLPNNFNPPTPFEFKIFSPYKTSISSGIGSGFLGLNVFHGATDLSEIDLKFSAPIPAVGTIGNNIEYGEFGGYTDVVFFQGSIYTIQLTDTSGTQLLYESTALPFGLNPQANGLAFNMYIIGYVNPTLNDNGQLLQVCFAGPGGIPLSGLGLTCYDLQLVTNCPSINLSASITDETAIAAQDGSITLTVNGGTGPYLYYWSNGETTQNLNNLLTDTYEVIVEDANNCSASNSFFVGVSPDSIISANLFASENTVCVGDTIDLIVNHQGGPAPYTYTWSNGAGNVNATTVSPITTTIYSVTVTDANGNSAFDGITVNVSSQPSNTISGTVRLSTNDSVANMKVLLVQVDSNFNVNAVDSSFTDVSGNFSFNYVGENLFVKAIPDSNLYPFEMPTYHYGDTEVFPFMLFYNYGLSTPSCGNDNLFFNTVAGNNPGGSGFISGNVFQGAGKQQNAAAVGQYVFLVNSNNEPVDYSVTNNDGYFSFSNIALADYRIFVDVPNFNINAAPSVSLNSNNPSAENIQYYLEDLVSSVVLKPYTKINEVQLYPNPSKGQFTITSEFNTEVKDIVLHIMDIQGKVVSEEIIKLNGKKLETVIDLSTHQKGCYFIQLKANEIVVNKKLMLY